MAYAFLYYSMSDLGFAHNPKYRSVYGAAIQSFLRPSGARSFGPLLWPQMGLIGTDFLNLYFNGNAYCMRIIIKPCKNASQPELSIYNHYYLR